LERSKKLNNLTTIDNLLFWDARVMMPAGGTPARSAQRGLLSSLRHDLLTEDVDEWLGAIDEAELSGEQRAVVREVRREHERVARVDPDLFEELSSVTSAANDAWETAREESDFETFAPHLERIVELKREYAAQVDPDREPFAVLFEEYEPYLGVDTAERVLNRLREHLVALLEDVRASDVDPGGAFEESFDSDRQMELSRDVLSFVDCDWDRARLDQSTHPFSYGNRYDMRITTRFDEATPVDGLTSTLHEFGHAHYSHGLDEENFLTPLGQARSHSIHESQSRFWENHVGRSEAFWEAFLPVLQKHFPGTSTVTPREAYEAANQIAEDNFVRVEADEVTYHLHIALRFEIERALVNGDIEVEEVPEVWDDKMETYLGIRPPDDARGCLQDIHWSIGRVGTFQNYTLGTVFSAQLQHALEADLGPLDELVRQKRFDEVQSWLTDSVHRHGQRYTTDDLVAEATGEPFTADYFIDYVDEKYGDLYDL
jgi:carboxypeptidase Taq